MSEVLKPCPFCGGEAERVDIDDGECAGGSYIRCIRCNAGTAVHFDRKEQLYSSWNDRKVLAAVPLQIEVRRILDEYSAWIARPDPEVDRKIAVAAAICALKVMEDLSEGREDG